MKAAILWEAFKNRLGHSDFASMSLDLGLLLQSSPELLCLYEAFSNEEIGHVVANLPSDKASGPDGFNTDFLKKCWPIIMHDFYTLCHDFHSGDVCLQSLNGSHIALNPKTEGPIRDNDFRPISLLNTSLKLITKLLAIRL